MMHSLPNDLLALVDAGDGVVRFVDPTTKRRFLLAEERPAHPCQHPETDEELCRMLQAADEQIQRGEVCELSTEQVLAEARRRAKASR